MRSHYGKRILAIVGTAVLLVSNLGSISHAVFAVESYDQSISGSESGGTDTASDIMSTDGAVSQSIIGAGETAAQTSGESTAPIVVQPAVEGVSTYIEEGSEPVHGSDEVVVPAGDAGGVGGSGAGETGNGTGETDTIGGVNSAAQGTGSSGESMGARSAEENGATAGANDAGTEDGNSATAGSGVNGNHGENTDAGIVRGSSENAGAENGASSNGPEGGSHDGANDAGNQNAGSGLTGETSQTDDEIRRDQQGEQGENPTHGDDAGDPEDDDADADEGESAETLIYDLKDSLTVRLETRESGKHEPAIDENGGYLYDLDETASTTLTLSNPSEYRLDETDGAIVRVYMQFRDNEPMPDAEETDPEAYRGKTQRPGEYTVKAEHSADQGADNGYTSGEQESPDGQASEDEELPDVQTVHEYTYTVTEVGSGLYCYEIDRPIDGDTISLEMTSVYKDVDGSQGGENRIWVKALTLDEAAALDEVDLTALDEATELEETDAASEDEIDDPEGSGNDDAVEDRKENDSTAEHNEDAQHDEHSHKATRKERIAYYRAHRDGIRVSEAAEETDVTTLRWIPKAAESLEILVQTVSTNNYIVSAAYTASAEIPEDARLRVTEYTEFDEEYQEAVEKAGGAINWLLDVSFYQGDQEIEPGDAISISVTRNLDDENESTSEVTEQKAREVITRTAEPMLLAEDDETTDDADRAGGADDNVDHSENDTDDTANDTTTIVHFAAEGTEHVTAEVSEETTTFVVDSLSLLADMFQSNEPMVVSATTQSSNEGNTVDSPNETPTKPSYTHSSNMSDALTGTENGKDIDSRLEGATADYASDPETSDIDNDFVGDISTDALRAQTEAQDGKLLTDKSVVYQDNGQFDVTLSALAQEFQVDTEGNVRFPVDVVFVIDTSRSMDKDNSGSSRRKSAVDATNKAIKAILNNHEANRVGVVTFSSGAWRLLELGRYTANSSGEYISQATSGSNYYVTSANGVSVESNQRGTIYSPNYVNGMYAGTFTQAGIAMGHQLFKNVEGDTTYTATYRDAAGDKAYKTVTRRPVIVLLSDGDPTYCSTSYDNVLSINRYGTVTYSNGRYGSGEGTGNNNKGVLGYYTILSAVSYKEQIARIYYGSNYAKHTENDADFYSVGMGINETGTNNASGANNSRSGDHYKRTVLNPSSTNIQYLNTATVSEQGIDNNATAKQLYTLLQQKWNSGSITVNSGSDTYTGAMGGQTNSRIDNPQKSYPSDKDYAYADAAWFDDIISSADLEKYFFSMLMWSQGYKNYDYVLQQNSSLKITDVIGEGMCVGDSPVLHFGQQDYPATSTTTDGNVTTYHYNYPDIAYATAYPQNADTNAESRKVEDSNGNLINRTYDLNQIKVTVTTGEDGQQTVMLEVPQDLLPTLYPEEYGRFYYEESPIRLQFKVKISESGIANAVKRLDDGEEVIYYTNATGQSQAVFNKDGFNPYAFDEDQAVNKTTNATQTDPTSFNKGLDNDTVTQLLGNNGRLILKPGLKVVKKWLDSSGNELKDLSEQPAITGTLHRSYIESTDSVTVTLRYDYQQYSKQLFGYDYDAEWRDVTVGTYLVAPNSSFVFYFDNVGSATMYYDPSSSDTNVATATLTNSGGRNVAVVNVLSGNSVTIAVGTNSIYSYGSSAPNPTVVFTQDIKQPGTGQSVEDNSFSESFTLSNDNDWKARWSPLDLNEDPNRTYSYWVTEDEVEGYTTSIDYFDLTHGLILTKENRTITITNQQKPSYVLPSTGGAGTLPYEVGGSAAILTSMIAGCSMWRRRRSERRCE